jgi:hypothetical protein
MPKIISEYYKNMNIFKMQILEWLQLYFNFVTKQYLYLTLYPNKGIQIVDPSLRLTLEPLQ